MTKAQIKIEIEKALEHAPESILMNVLDFLKTLQNQPEDRIKLANNLRDILHEDKELLQRLAQ